MNLSKLLDSVPGIIGGVVCDDKGACKSSIGPIDQELLAGVMASIADRLNLAGESLGLGQMKKAMLSERRISYLMARSNGMLATVAVKPQSPIGPIMEALDAVQWGIDAPDNPEIAQQGREAEKKSDRSEMLRMVRQLLIQGRVVSAADLGKQIVELDRIQNPNESDSFEGALLNLVENISGILNGGNRSCANRLQHIAKSKEIDASLRWVAQIWCARALTSCGALNGALKSAFSAVELASTLDAEAISVSLCTLAEITFFDKDYDKALSTLQSGRKFFDACGDERIQATTWLTEARIHEARGNIEECIRAAREARRLSPSWAVPTIYLARQALRRRDVDEAESLISPMLKQDPCLPEIAREQQLLEMIRRGDLTIEAANEYLQLLEAPPTDENIQLFEKLVERVPDAMPLRLALAWKLFGSSRFDQAHLQFHALADRDLSPDLQSPVLLGLGCLANVESHNEHIGARLRAAVDAASTGPRATGARTNDIHESPQVTRAEMTSRHEVMEIKKGESGFSGELQLFSVPDLLLMLRAGGRTGMLVCSTKGGIGAIHLRDGIITGAAAPGTENIGDILLRQGLITAAQLSSAIDVQKSGSSNRPMGTLLVDKGFVDPEFVKKALTEQSYKAIRVLLSWMDGSFVFHSETTAKTDSDEIEISLDPQMAVLQWYKEIDEESRNSEEGVPVNV